MRYCVVDTSPSAVRASLRAIAIGNKPPLTPVDESPSPATWGEWTRYATNLFALEDPRREGRAMLEPKFHALAAKGSIVASVLCNEDGSDFEFLSAYPYRVTGPELYDVALPLVRRGLAWIGAAALVDDVPQFEFETLPPRGETFNEMRRAFLAHCRALNGDSIEWLRALWALEDPRGPNKEELYGD